MKNFCDRYPLYFSPQDVETILFILGYVTQSVKSSLDESFSSDLEDLTSRFSTLRDLMDLELSKRSKGLT